MPVDRASRRKSIVLAPSRRHLVSEKEAEIVKNDLETALEKKEESIDAQHDHKDILSEHSATPLMDSYISEDLPPAHSLSPIVAPEAILNSELIVVPLDLTIIEQAVQELESENVHQEIELEPIAQETVVQIIEKLHRGSSAAEETAQKETEAEKRAAHEATSSRRTSQADARRRAQAKINHQKINQKTVCEAKAAGLKRTLKRGL